MRRIVLALVVLSVPLSAFAQQKRAAAPATAPAAANPSVRSSGGQALSPNGGSDTCGLGWQVTDKRTMIATTTRGTTNYFVPYTFGMTTGTMGCEQHSFAKNELDTAVYAQNNFEALSVEAAAGQGEYLTAFAQSMGCADASVVGRLMQANYADLSAKSNGVEMYKSVREIVRSSALNCSNVI